MEFIFVFCSVLISLLVVNIVHKKFNSISKNKHPSSPPGPRKLPFIGNIHQLLGSSLPHHTFRNLATKYGPIMHLQLGERPVIVVSSPEIAKEVLRTHDLIFANRPISQASWIITYQHSDIAFAPYGDHWRQMRKICTLELLSPKRVLKFRSIREDEVSNMMESIMLKERQVVNLSKIIFSLSYAVISRSAFGDRSKYHDEFIALVDNIVHLLGGFNISDMFPSIKILQLLTRGFTLKIQKLHNQVDKIIETIVNEHKERVIANHETTQESKDHDLVDVLLNIQRHGESDVPLTDTIIKAVIYDMFAAGGETSSSTMEWAISELIRNPSIMKKAQTEVRQVFDERGNVDESMLDELNYLQNVVKETLRLHPPAVLILPRQPSEKCEINGYDIPEKTTVMINAWAMGRDPKYWVDADKFNPDRFLDSKIDYKGNNFEYVPFGAGRRICPGISFAIPSIQLTLAQLLFHFDWKLPGDISPQELDMTEKFGVTVRRKNDLELIPVPYHRSCFIGK